MGSWGTRRVWGSFESWTRKCAGKEWIESCSGCNCKGSTGRRSRPRPWAWEGVPPRHLGYSHLDVQRSQFAWKNCWESKYEASSRRPNVYAKITILAKKSKIIAAGNHARSKTYECHGNVAWNQHVWLRRRRRTNANRWTCPEPSFTFADGRLGPQHRLLPLHLLKLLLRSQLLPLYPPKKQQQTKKKQRAMRRINLATLTKQYPIIKRHGNYTRISLILIIFLLRTLKREIMKLVLKKLKELWKKAVKSVLISN